VRAPLLLVPLVAALLLADSGRLQRDVRTKRFATAVVCEACHSNAADSGAMRDHQGRGIAPHDLWRSSMMANAARDPFFRAVLAAEAAGAGEKREAVEARCLHCHAPMASFEARAEGRPGVRFDQLDEEFEEHVSDTAALARDGVSCTLCHQILPGAKLDGAFEVGEDREMFGPFDEQFGLAMHRVTKYWPVQGRHVLESTNCASCHASTLPGEVTFLEWRNSSRAKTCQECHMPSGDRTRIARTSHGGDIANLIPRSPVGRHLFVGGNTLVPRILRDNIDALHAKAPPEAFDATVAAARTLLREQTARVSIRETTRGVDLLHVVVRVENLAGHKLPTGHASRRAWLRLRVLDAKGAVVFASGEFDAKGILLDRAETHAGEAAGGPVEPHRMRVSKASEVQIYEAVPEGARVPVHGERSLRKDNRLLPAGWDAGHADAAATRPVGIGADEDFVAGSDEVVYDVPFPEIAPPYSIEVALFYQPISPRYAAELFRVDHPEIVRFRRLFEAAGNPPELIATDRLVVTE
jgi:hypothetical protein